MYCMYSSVVLPGNRTVSLQNIKRQCDTHPHEATMSIPYNIALRESTANSCRSANAFPFHTQTCSMSSSIASWDCKRHTHTHNYSRFILWLQKSLPLTCMSYSAMISLSFLNLAGDVMFFSPPQKKDYPPKRSSRIWQITQSVFLPKAITWSGSAFLNSNQSMERGRESECVRAAETCRCEELSRRKRQQFGFPAPKPSAALAAAASD